MKISQNGINLIKKYEGCRLEAYLCPSGIWTIGYGHTGGDVYRGATVTQPEADRLLAVDLERFEAAVADTVKLPLNQNQFDALVSFTYNCGLGNLQTLIKNRSLEEIANALTLYNKGSGRVLDGLVKRRAEERALFLSGGAGMGQNNDTGSGVIEYSKAKDGGVEISANFVVREFACKDGSDKILVDVGFVVDKLQSIRNHFSAPVIINSAYRTESYNKKVGGTSKSYHLHGKAFDIEVKGRTSAEVAKYAQKIGIRGIIRYGSFVHVDSRVKRYWAKNSDGKETPVSRF